MTLSPLRRPAWRTPAGPAGLLLAALLAVAFACWLYGLPFMLGRAASWQIQDGDIAQYVAGFNAYVHEPWHWPLFRIESINTPGGTLTTFVDAVPLYALLLKLLAHGPDVPFRNPYPAWIALCYLLQGVGAWWICREARLRSWCALLALAVLLAAFPALTRRFFHISLMSQWLLLFGLAIYLRASRLGHIATRHWCALLLAACYINMYLFCMLSLLFGADLLRQARRHGWRGAAGAALAAVLLVALSLLLTVLPLGEGSGAREWGFGYYSMNLLAPLTGGTLLHWPYPIGTPGQYEGRNYLGVFLLLATAFALRLRRRHDPLFWQRHRALLAVLAGMTLYALSNNVYLGELHLVDLDLPRWMDAFTGQMRVSGRFFWPVGYAVIVFTVVSIARLAGPRRAAWLLALLVALQLWDLRDHHREVRLQANQPAKQILHTADWDAFLGPRVSHLQVYPPFGCPNAGGAQTLLPVMLYAVQHRMSISTGYVARVKKPCDNYAEEIAGLRGPETAFAFFKSHFPTIEAARQHLGGATPPACIDVDFVWLCRREEQQQ